MIGTVRFLVASVIVVGPGSPRASVSLPPLNASVVDFAQANLGKPVGNGICITLAIEALKAAGACRPSFRDPSGDYSWGEPIIDFKDVLPGDILQFRDAVFHGRRSIGRGRWRSWHQEYPHHTAIVAKVEERGRILKILHQNITVAGQDESVKGRVQETELRMSSLQKGGWVKAYRPVAPPDPADLKPLDEFDVLNP
ncbi:hypothetical protein P12x_004120 [Tundrisphaera lichenicola]|uniref:hypothetical protein n=1 Tax=Tundrisphaera lichenicola TaxID=2029860 RepID=UPI003EC12F5A